MLDTLENIKEIILKKKIIIISVLIILVLGLLFGSIYITILNNNDKKELLNNVDIYFESFKDISIKDKINIFKESFIKNIISFMIIWVLGISMVGFPVILTIIFYKSFLLGYSISSIFAKYKVLGLYRILIYIFPTKIILLLLSIILAIYSINISDKMIYSCIKKKTFNFNAYMGKYFLLLLICIIASVIGALIDAFIIPIFYNIKIG